MVGLLDIEGIRVVLDGVWYEAEEVAVGTNFDVVWPQQAQSAIQSIGLTMPTGFVVANSPLTQSGTLAVSYDPAYGLPTLAAQAAWNLLVEAFTVTKSGNSITNIQANADLSVSGDIVSTGNITAGSVGADSGLTNYILYRLDDWEDYDDTDQSMWGWVPAAHIVGPRFSWLYSQVDLLWAAIEAAGGGSGSSLYYYLNMPSPFSVAYSTSGSNVTITVSLPEGYVIPTQEQLESSAFFRAIKNNGVTIGAEALYDLYILQNEGSGSGSGDDVWKNITEILRHIEYTTGTPGTMSFDTNIVASGNITAGALGTGSGISNMILYRLDDWMDYTSEKADWVPAASIVNQRLVALENAIAANTDVQWGTEVPDLSAVLSINGVSKTLALAAGYVQKSVFESVFNIQTESVSLLPAGNGYTERHFNVPGNIVATGNITAGAVGIDSGISNYILYRLDNWEEYSQSKTNWVPSAGIVNQLRQAIASGGYDDSDLWDAIADRIDVDVTQNGRIAALEALPRIVYVKPNETWPPAAADMVENWFYVKLEQTS